MGEGLDGTWNDRVDSWHHHVTNSPAFDAVRQEVFRRAAADQHARCLDLGAGTGFLTLPLAGSVAHVVAVDIAPAMTEDLERRAKDEGVGNVETMACDLTTLRFADESFDAVVSNYALHHVTHVEKRALVARARRWLRPGGRLVVADMMFGRGLAAGDRRVLAAKAKALAAKGPGGLWRIAKNVTRLGLGVGDERPAPPEFWTSAFVDAGFVDVGHLQVVQEAGVVWGTAPVVGSEPERS
jgi:2-polyprenyl-3-methyl-5-hydroxy-6-metoxy-1,4-benzoquinol methylase